MLHICDADKKDKGALLALHECRAVGPRESNVWGIRLLVVRLWGCWLKVTAVRVSNLRRRRGFAPCGPGAQNFAEGFGVYDKGKGVDCTLHGPLKAIQKELNTSTT